VTADWEGPRPATQVARTSSAVSRKGAASRETLLRASTAVFAERGFAAATMRDIAERAGMPLSAFYYYFASKHRVLVAIMEGVLADLDASCVAATAEDDEPAAKLAAMVASHVRVHLRDPAAARVADGELRALDDNSREAILSQRDAYEGRFRSVLEQGRRTGEFAADLDVSVAVMSILMMSTGVIAWWRADGPLSVEQTADAVGGFAVSIAVGRRVR
jgi:AcrR family transcriptional regulator